MKEVERCVSILLYFLLPWDMIWFKLSPDLCAYALHTTQYCLIPERAALWLEQRFIFDIIFCSHNHYKILWFRFMFAIFMHTFTFSPSFCLYISNKTCVLKVYGRIFQSFCFLMFFVVGWEYERVCVLQNVMRCK